MIIHIQKIQEHMIDEACYVIQESILNSWTKYPIKLLLDICKKYNRETILLRISKGDLRVAIHDNKIIGTIALERNIIRTFYVSRRFQGMGIGTKLFKVIKRQCESQGYKKLIITASYYGVPISLRNGFRLVGKVKKERIGIGFTDYALHLNLE